VNKEGQPVSQNGKRKTHGHLRRWPAALLAATLTLAGSIEAADAEGEKGPAGPPGVIIEPPRAGKGQQPLTEQEQRSQEQPSGGGCPVNDRKLELMV
jgi:hypothetical protein